ncbi:hypothetical protein D5086_031550 [Populus alba]|uniref:Uncharacterized protein n=1 Tax=Populus alba TaxID=43335 RepID=A0ACC4AIZ6_POPAL
MQQHLCGICLSASPFKRSNLSNYNPCNNILVGFVVCNYVMAFVFAFCQLMFSLLFMFCSWNATYESLLGSNKPFARPVPLAEMVDFLVDVWEQEGLYD